MKIRQKIQYRIDVLQRELDELKKELEATPDIDIKELSWKDIVRNDETYSITSSRSAQKAAIMYGFPYYLWDGLIHTSHDCYVIAKVGDNGEFIRASEIDGQIVIHND